MRGTVAKRIRRSVREAGGGTRAYRLTKKLHNGTADIAPMDPDPSRPRARRRTTLRQPPKAWRRRHPPRTPGKWRP